MWALFPSWTGVWHPVIRSLLHQHLQSPSHVSGTWLHKRLQHTHDTGLPSQPDHFLPIITETQQVVIPILAWILKFISIVFQNKLSQYRTKVHVCMVGWTQQLKINWPKRVTSLFYAAPSTCRRIPAALDAITSTSTRIVDPGSNLMTTTSALLVVASSELWNWMLHGETQSLDWGVTT